MKPEEPPPPSPPSPPPPNEPAEPNALADNLLMVHRIYEPESPSVPVSNYDSDSTEQVSSEGFFSPGPNLEWDVFSQVSNSSLLDAGVVVTRLIQVPYPFVNSSDSEDSNAATLGSIQDLDEPDTCDELDEEEDLEYPSEEENEEEEEEDGDMYLFQDEKI